MVECERRSPQQPPRAWPLIQSNPRRVVGSAVRNLARQPIKFAAMLGVSDDDLHQCTFDISDTVFADIEIQVSSQEKKGKYPVAVFKGHFGGPEIARKFKIHRLASILNFKVFILRSIPLKTYLPDVDIDLSAFSNNRSLKDTWASEHHICPDHLRVGGNERLSDGTEFYCLDVEHIGVRTSCEEQQEAAKELERAAEK
ncbi:hypothetical protein Tco_1256393 [Tanacetum coccineum]